MSDDGLGDDDLSRALAGAEVVIEDNHAWADFSDHVEEQALPNGSVGPYQDDFQRLLETRRLAQNIAGPQDDLVTEIAHRRLDHEAAKEQAPWVRTNPYSAAQEGILGGIYSVTSGGATAKCIKWEGNDSEATGVSISLSIEEDQNTSYPTALAANGTAASYRPFAIIKWGTRGASHTATVDIGRGCQISLAAACVDVEVGMDAAQSAYAAGTAKIAATLGFNRRSGPAPAQRTIYVDALGNGGATFVAPIPRMATRLLSIMRSDIAAGSSMQVDFRDTNGAVLYSFSLTGTAQQGQPIPVSDDAYDVRVTNNGGAASSNYRLVFELSL